MPRKYKLDDIDFKILKILSQNAKISNIDLSKKIGISPSPCLRRVKILQQKKLILGYYANVNLEELGYSLVVFASLNIDYTKKEEKELFEKELNLISEVLEVYSLSSDKDYLVKLLVKDYVNYKVVVNSSLTKLPCIKHIRTTRIKSILKHKNFIE